MTRAERASKGDDYLTVRRVTRDRKLINKGWRWVATSEQLGQARRQAVGERSGDDAQKTDSPHESLPKSNRSSKRRKNKAHGHVIIERAKELAHAAQGAEQPRELARRALQREAEEQAILQKSRLNLTDAAGGAASH